MDLQQFEKLRPREFQELVSDPVKLAGIWESSQQGTELFEQQKSQAESNLAAATAIEEQAQRNAKLRAELVAAAAALESKHQDWQRAEAEMHSALEPVSRQGIRQRLERLYHESEDVCEALQGSWTRQDDLQAFISEFLQQQEIKHTRRLKLEAL